MQKATRRRYSAKFREDAVRKVEEGERIPDAAKALEVPEKTLGNWVYAARRSTVQPKGTMSVNEMEMELYRLRSENTQLKIDKEILKKAAVFFVKESQQ